METTTLALNVQPMRISQDAMTKGTKVWEFDTEHSIKGVVLEFTRHEYNEEKPWEPIEETHWMLVLQATAFDAWNLDCSWTICAEEQPNLDACWTLALTLIDRILSA